MSPLGPLLRVLLGQIKVSASTAALDQAYSGCWQNQTPCGCGTWVSIFLLAVSQESLAPRGCL